jgi:hypothetical protein
MSIDVHTFVKDANDGHAAGCDPKVDHVPFNAAAAITWTDVSHAGAVSHPWRS